MAIHKDFVIVKAVLCSVTSPLKVSARVRARVCVRACVLGGGGSHEVMLLPLGFGGTHGLIIPNITALARPVNNSSARVRRSHW